MTAKALKAYEARYPEIAWREPIKVTNSDTGDWGWACRVCVGMFGMSGKDIRNLTQDRAVMERHIEEFHVSEAAA